jgi:hypothetical protein
MLKELNEYQQAGIRSVVDDAFCSARGSEVEASQAKGVLPVEVTAA